MSSRRADFFRRLFSSQTVCMPQSHVVIGKSAKRSQWADTCTSSTLHYSFPLRYDFPSILTFPIVAIPDIDVRHRRTVQMANE